MRSTTQSEMASSSWTSGCTAGCFWQNSCSTGVSTGANADLGPADWLERVTDDQYNAPREE